MNEDVFLATIRDRWQLTIPYPVRQQVAWAQENGVVEISTDEEGIRLRPYTNYKGKRLSRSEWKKLWQQIKTVRAYKGRGGNLSGFIARDRQRH